ncbi:MAG: hypothetical protein A2Y89_04265 [Chloroflexi bacterium RBG_13_51_18]|nr:MAG: hypothetical protein A2Y89_04265 [Chloroflexi bacterium RBG_13_51_18]
MVLVWDNIKSFQQHLEDMRVFRDSHTDTAPAPDLRTFKAMPIPFDITLPCETGQIKSFYDSKGKLMIVPIWQIDAPRDSQN